VREHFAVGARAAGVGGWDVARVLALFPHLRRRLRHRGGKLPGGEQGMVACGRALVGNPKILLMDEPSEGLAPLLVREFGRILLELKSEGTSILLVTAASGNRRTRSPPDRPSMLTGTPRGGRAGLI
jgi:branched-chain amino acid transport system ATP-binding protein